MPKTQKSPLDAKTKQITDFFPKKSLSQTSTISSIASPGGATQKILAKQDATPRLRSHAKVTQENIDIAKPVKKPGSQRAGSGTSPSTKAVLAGVSPMPPPTKRLRSQSIVSPQRVKQSKRSKNILCDSDFDRKMDVDDDSVVYVPSVPSTLPVPLPSPPVTTINAKEAKLSEKQGSPSHCSENAAFVPSSVSEERELGPVPVEEKINAKGNTSHRQDQGLSSPATDGNGCSPLGIQSQCVPLVAADSVVDWDMDGGLTGISTTLSRPTTATSITTPPSIDEPAAPSASPPEILDEKTRAEQIIKEIKLKARAFAQAQESSSPVLEIPSPVTSDDDDDNNGVGILPVLNFRRSTKLQSPIRPKRYSLRKPSSRVTSDKQKTTPGSPSRPSPPIKRKSLTANPLDALLKEKRTINAKDGMASEDRESRLRALADLDLNDDSENDESLQNTKINMRAIKEEDGNPFIDDKQRQQVMDILEDDESIESEEEHIRELGNVGAKLWDSSEICSVDSYDAALSPIEYRGSDPSLLMLAQTIAGGDCALIPVIIDSGALEMANYTDGGENVIGLLIDLALSHRNDNTLNLSACRLLPHVLRNRTISGPVLLLGRIFVLLRVLGAQSSVLERMGWVVRNGQRSVSDDERTSIIERLILLIEETARARLLSRREIPDIIAILLLIGLEPSVSHEMRLYVSHTIHQVCQSIGENGNVEIEVESAICHKVLHLLEPFSPQNKLFTLDLLASASGRTARVARSVAHSLLTNKSALLPSQYSALPPLSELLIMFKVSSSNSRRPVGKFEIHDATDYVDMASWTFILAIALTDIFQYVESGEANKPVASLVASPSTKSPIKEKDGSIIHALHENLYKIHNRIQDNRAAHLDRSRTKAILFQIAFRVLYQCQAVTQNRKKTSQNIQNYFLRKQVPS